MSELPAPLDVIAVGAHPDDVEIAVGGTIALLAGQGYRVGIVDLTDGEPTPLSPGPESRLAEAEAAARVLGACERFTLDLPNRRLFDSFESRVALAKVFRRWRPRLVLGIADKTPLASPDHWQAMQITDAAIFYSRLTKWDDSFDGLPVHTVAAQLWYPLGFSALEPPPTAGRFVVDVSETIESKLASIACYQSQFPPAKAHLFDRVRGMAAHFGGLAGCAAGELLLSPKALRTTDPLRLLFGDAADA